MKFILGMWIPLSEFKNLIVFYWDQRLLKISGGENLVNTITPKLKLEGNRLTLERESTSSKKAKVNPVQRRSKSQNLLNSIFLKGKC